VEPGPVTIERTDGPSGVLPVPAPVQAGPRTPRSTRLRPEEMRAWRAFLVAHSRATRLLEDELIEVHDLPLAWYDVLVQLVEAPQHRLRMTDLAGAVLISRSGLTRLVDRMVAEGLVRREPAPHDARGTFACLTDEGYGRLRAATPTHLRGIGGYFIDRVSPEQLRALGEACALIAAPDEPAAD
jgi:DNA-binding MarR family transcriptional regulator